MSRTLAFMLLLLSLPNGEAADIKELKKEAVSKLQHQQATIQASSNKVAELYMKALEYKRHPPQEAQPLPSVKYRVYPAYISTWKKPDTTKYRVVQDYSIELDYRSKEHLEHLQNQINEWLGQGYFIYYSEIDKLEDQNIAGSVKKVRLVK